MSSRLKNGFEMEMNYNLMHRGSKRLFISLYYYLFHWARYLHSLDLVKTITKI